MTSTNPTLDDELTSINSIFTESTLTPVSEDHLICTLTLPSLPSVSLRLEFPPTYPDAPPSILGTQTVGDGIPKGVGTHIVDIARTTLAEIYTIGEPCIYDLLEELREALEKAQDNGSLGIHEHEHEHENEIQEDASSPRARDQVAGEGFGEPPPWTLAPPISEKKSVFLARVARVDSPTQAKTFLAHLLATDKKAAKATHNITAWRIRGSDTAHAGADITYQDCDDDGETAAGGRVLHLMQLMDVWDVMVVVTRWYGGVHLGPDRFRIINSAAREALVLGGFVKGEAEGKGKKKP